MCQNVMLKMILFWWWRSFTLTVCLTSCLFMPSINFLKPFVIVIYNCLLCFCIVFCHGWFFFIFREGHFWTFFIVWGVSFEQNVICFPTNQPTNWSTRGIPTLLFAVSPFPLFWQVLGKNIFDFDTKALCLLRETWDVFHRHIILYLSLFLESKMERNKKLEWTNGPLDHLLVFGI